MGTRSVTPLTARQRVDWLRLIRAENVGPVTFRQLVNRCGSVSAALDALPRLAAGRGLPIRVPTVAEAEDEIAAVEASGARLVASCEADYPELLRHISGPPPLLTVAGRVECLRQSRAVAMVGARNASAAGQKFTRTLAADLGRAGFVVVSGLARGIDAAAHHAALDTGTIAVLAGGIDQIYPSENIPLADAIVRAGGALVTEMPLRWEPRARDFPRRNRLVAGLALGVVVVEAAKRSGSLITARLALEQNREVFAVPGSPLDPRAEGGNSLIQQGASLVTSAADVIEGLETADPSRYDLLEADWEPPGGSLIDEPPSDGDRGRLLDALSHTPMPVDALIETTGLGVPTVQTLLIELDLAGRVQWSSGQLVALRD